MVVIFVMCCRWNVLVIKNMPQGTTFTNLNSFIRSTRMPVVSHECLICGKFVVSFVLYKNRSLEGFQSCEGHIIQKLKSKIT